MDYEKNNPPVYKEVDEKPMFTVICDEKVNDEEAIRDTLIVNTTIIPTALGWKRIQEMLDKQPNNLTLSIDPETGTLSIDPETAYSFVLTDFGKARLREILEKVNYSPFVLLNKGE